MAYNILLYRVRLRPPLGCTQSRLPSQSSAHAQMISRSSSLGPRFEVGNRLSLCLIRIQ